MGLATQGFVLTKVKLPAVVHQSLAERNWVALDQAIGLEARPGGVIFQELLRFDHFSEIEFIISIRSSQLEPDEDGIWHDDGSRHLAFSLSLTLNPAEVVGGYLEIRKIGQETAATIPTPALGELIVFATGTRGYEHRIKRVLEGERIIIAGWCTDPD